jgi:hypothetical protein
VSDRGDSSSPPTEAKLETTTPNGEVVEPAEEAVEPAATEKVTQPATEAGEDAEQTGQSPGQAQQIGTSSAVAQQSALWRLHPCVRNVVEALTPWFADLHYMLLNPPVQKAVNTTYGVLEPPLGAVRLQIARLVAALVSLRHRPISATLAQLGTLQVLVVSMKCTSSTLIFVTSLTFQQNMT